jgi:hypothetical protein
MIYFAVIMGERMIYSIFTHYIVLQYTKITVSNSIFDLLHTSSTGTYKW